MRPVPKQYKMHFGFGELYPPALQYLTIDGRHKGFDFLTPKGINVIASVDGILNFAGWKRGFGNCVYIKFWAGRWLRQTTYRLILAHLDKILIEKKINARIGKWETIGLSGDSGMALNHPHLHLQCDQLIQGQWIPVNPSFAIGAT
ncbi:MAG: hypothetical protein A2309_02895 [Bacteroidetes bacterium RIFOXYB2_FULL_35_7]|nr:MAG: hypothetical protein A2309_02895 [Bacteroidetes bacterium RIFOXYB2_FULL_35_7]